MTTVSSVSCSWDLFADDLCFSVIDHSVLGFIAEVIIFLIAFWGLALAAEHLCNSMETLCDHWSIHEDVGGATFIALGGAIPEITINCISTFKGSFHKSEKGGSSALPTSSVADLGVGAILGSGMIAYLLIPSLSCLFSSPKRLFIRKKALMRDSAFYVAAGLVLITALYHGVNKYHGPILVLIYVIYVIYLVYGDHMHFWWSRAIGQPHLHPAALSETPPSVFRERYTSMHGASQQQLVPLLPVSDGPDGLEQAGGSDSFLSTSNEENLLTGVSCGPTILGYLLMIIKAFMRPLETLINYTCPDCRIFQKYENFYGLTFITAFAWITWFSFIITCVIGRWVVLLNIPGASAVFGLVIVAVGAEIPDSVNSITIAKRGFGGMATSACLGSQVINICLGLGMPWLLTMVMGHSVHIASNNSFVHVSSSFLLFDVALLVIVSFVWNMPRTGRQLNKQADSTAAELESSSSSSVEITKPKSIFLIAWYIVSVVYLASYCRA